MVNFGNGRQTFYRQNSVKVIFGILVKIKFGNGKIELVIVKYDIF